MKGAAILVESDNLDEAARVFRLLSAGGNVTVPFGRQPWGAEFGMLVDAYGAQWMVNCEV